MKFKTFFSFFMILACCSSPAKDFQQKDGFYLDDKNLKIETDCKERLPVRELSRFYHQTMQDGKKCLKDLSTSGPVGEQIISCFDQLFADQGNPPKLLCGSWPFGKEIGAVGSFPGSSKRHPYLWLGPKLPDLYRHNPQELKSIIFHEMIHNCGYLHSEGLEIAYTCEECCFNKILPSDRKDSACRICSGKYENEFSLDYQRDLLNWSQGYKTWGRDMRRSVFMAATKKENLNSFELLLSYVTVVEKEKSFLRPIFLSRSAQNKKALILEFEGTFASSLSSNDKLQQLIEWFKISAE